ncbi:DUF6588 family protein [Fibrobacter sp.]|uniref:DUF6588 family protein n=1 Tax=Fibrobacter sp. TaxID=35828 RepID=UPI00262E0995|nr:DUF6588 family protein [Fibrobacter sp.]MDD7498142.1 hypothetical protein [Fibrobacter sp.]MDY5725038.1 DUF6588 family protein [Fibrobacter sp.]
MKKSALFAFLVLGLGSAFATDEDGWASTYESLSAFQKSPVSKDGSLNPYANRPGYVKPIIDNLGNVLNSNWYVSASVPQSFTFEAGLPISIISIGDDDRNYTENAEFLGQSIAYETPTIFGDHRDMTQADDGRIYGNKTLNGLGLFTYPYIQLGASFYHARVVFRGMFLPSISELRKFNLFGFGLQYSFGHFFQYMLPPAVQPLDVSIVFGYNTSGIGYRPEDYKGELNLDVSTTNFAIVIGYKPVSFIEVMMSLGYQSAEMKSSGHLRGAATIDPGITVEGNNGFRFGLEVAFQLGKSFHPIVGFDYAGKSSFTTNVLYFKQQFGEDKTPDEIAKEKGFVRGAKKAEQTTESSEQSNETPAETNDAQLEETEEAPAVDEVSSEETSTEDSFNEE